MRRRVSVDLDQSDQVLSISVEWFHTLSGECAGLWTDPNPVWVDFPVAAFEEALHQRRAIEQLDFADADATWRSAFDDEPPWLPPLAPRD